MSQGERFSDMAGHVAVLKNYHHTYYLRLIFKPITCKNSLKQVFLFYCVSAGKKKMSMPHLVLLFLFLLLR